MEGHETFFQVNLRNLKVPGNIQRVCHSDNIATQIEEGQSIEVKKHNKEVEKNLT